MALKPARKLLTTREPTVPGERQRSARVGPALLFGLAVVTGILGLGIYSAVRARSAADATLESTTADAAVSVVNVVSPTASASTQEIRLPGTTQAFTDAPLFARTSGYVKAWYLDIGVLINAGSNTSGRELFHMTAIHTLRVFVAVPEVYSRAARPGSPATLTLDEFPGRSFKGTLVRNANAIDLTSRTLLVEVDVDNPSGELLPGAYVFVHLKLPEQIASATVPANTLLFRAEGIQIAVVRDGQAQLIPVTNRS